MADISTLAGDANFINEQSGLWVAFWKGLGFEINASRLLIPKQRPGFYRLVVIPHGLLIQEMYDICSDMFQCWKWTHKSLDSVISLNDRNPYENDYAVWMRLEVGGELKNLSADDLREHNIVSATVLECLVDEAEHFKRTGKYQDSGSVILCAGSRTAEGNVPSIAWVDPSERIVYWSYSVSGLYVNCFQADHSLEHVIPREVVS